MLRGIARTGPRTGRRARFSRPAGSTFRSTMSARADPRGMPGRSWCDPAACGGLLCAGSAWTRWSRCSRGSSSLRAQGFQQPDCSTATESPWEASGLSSRWPRRRTGSFESRSAHRSTRSTASTRRCRRPLVPRSPPRCRPPARPSAERSVSSGSCTRAPSASIQARARARRVRSRPTSSCSVPSMISQPTPRSLTAAGPRPGRRPSRRRSPKARRRRSVCRSATR